MVISRLNVLSVQDLEWFCWCSTVNVVCKLFVSDLCVTYDAVSCVFEVYVRSSCMTNY